MVEVKVRHQKVERWGVVAPDVEDVGARPAGRVVSRRCASTDDEGEVPRVQLRGIVEVEPAVCVERDVVVLLAGGGDATDVGDVGETGRNG